MDIQSAATTQGMTPPSSAATVPPKSHLWAGKSFSFHDILDAINPLQHLPIIGTIYRHLTGDTIGNAARVVGDTLYGGPIGLATSLVNAYEVNKTGKDVGDHVLAMFEGNKSKTPSGGVAPDTALAAASPTAPALPPAPAANAAAMPPGSAIAALPSKPLVGLPDFPADAPAASGSDAPIALASAQGPVSAPPVARPIPLVATASKGIAIDTSALGIQTMRAHAQSGAGVPFELPAGVMLTNQPRPMAALSTTDFALKMKQGLAKYQALLAQQAEHQSPAAQPAS